MVCRARLTLLLFIRVCACFCLERNFLIFFVPFFVFKILVFARAAVCYVFPAVRSHSDAAIAQSTAYQGLRSLFVPDLCTCHSLFSNKCESTTSGLHRLLLFLCDFFGLTSEVFLYFLHNRIRCNTQRIISTFSASFRCFSWRFPSARCGTS